MQNIKNTMPRQKPKMILRLENSTIDTLSLGVLADSPVKENTATRARHRPKTIRLCCKVGKSIGKNAGRFTTKR